MIIYVPQITNRILFTIDVILGRLLNIHYDFTTDIEYFKSVTTEKLAYSPEPITQDQTIWIQSYPLLFESSYQQYEISPTLWNEIQLFFPTSSGAFPIDIFAVSFFLISRYEEYNSNLKRDIHQRILIEETVAYQLGFHRKPVVNMIAMELASVIKEHYPHFTCQKPPFSPITTYDVDIAYQYKGKSVYRFIGSTLKSIFQFDFNKVFKNIQALLDLKHSDSYDRFHLHEQKAIQEQRVPIHFILTAPFSKFNKNIDPKSKAFKQLIAYLQTFSEIGLHPSYHSSEKTTLIPKEKRQLEMIGKKSVKKSRQHFLKFQFPSTFEALIDAGIEEDYSLGWYNEVGFRLSITIPVPFFNIKTNEVRPLTLYPLIVMDGALYQCCESIAMCQQTIQDLENEVQNFGGTFVVLYHNNTDKQLF